MCLCSRGSGDTAVDWSGAVAMVHMRRHPSYVATAIFMAVSQMPAWQLKRDALRWRYLAANMTPGTARHDVARASCKHGAPSTSGPARPWVRGTARRWPCDWCRRPVSCSTLSP